MWICCSKSTINIHTEEPKKDWEHARVSIKRSRFKSWTINRSSCTARPPWVVEATRKKSGHPPCASYRSKRAKSKDNFSFSRQSSIIGNVLEYAFIRTVFLDIDGTLNHPNGFGSPTYVICPECVNCLKKIIEQTGCNIVLSSAWRLNPQHRRTLFTYLRAIEVEKGVMIGETRDLSCQTKSRTDEIRDWLLNPNLYKEGVSAIQPWQIQSWVSLDDMDLKGMESEEELKSHHFTIDPSLGLCKTQDIVMKVVQKLRGGWNATYYRDRWQVAQKRRIKRSREISLKNLETVEDLYPWPETIHEDKSSDEVSYTDFTFFEKVSGVDDTYTESSQLGGDRSNVCVSRNGYAVNLERGSSVQVFSKYKSHSHTNSCKLIFQSRANGASASRVQYPPSMLENAQARTNPGYHVQERHSMKEDQLQETLKSKIKRRSSNMSFSLGDLTKRGSILYSSIASESNIGELSSINLGSHRHPIMSGRRTRNSVSYGSMYFIGDCTAANGASEEDGE